MDIESIRESFDRVTEKQSQSSTQAQELIDQVIKELDLAVTQIQQTTSTDPSPILAQLKIRISEIAPLAQLEGCQKELNLALAKYGKTLEKTFNSDISRAYRNVDTDTKTIDEIIATHFYRQGQFDLGDILSSEAHLSDSNSLKSPFEEMHSILQAMKSHNLDPALTWAARNSEKLRQSGSTLELKLHQLQFIEILKKGSRDDALKYARTHLAPFAPVYKTEIQKLIACLLWAGRLDQSPYSNLISPAHWDELADDLASQFCSLLDQAYESPLGVSVSAGAEGLPTLLKLASVMAAKRQEWQEMKQLPVPLDLSREFQFHSVFVCPVLREQGSDENPPMLMPCGHVLSKQSVLKLSKNSTRGFKCPYCPLEATVAQCRQLYF